MAERFINLRPWEVRAFLAGRKTRLTRVVKPQPIGRQRVIEGLAHITKGMNPADDGAVWYVADGIGPGIEIRCSFGSPGDVLIGREKWFEEYDPMTVRPFSPPRYCYAATHEGEWPVFMDGNGSAEVNRDGSFKSPWRSASTMPRDASRIRLHVEAVRVQRVQEITEEEAIAEGSANIGGTFHKDNFAAQWDIDNKRHPWASNPWTWVGTVRMENT